MTDPSLSSAPSAPIPELSVVAPMYNEEGNIEAFVVAVEKVLATLGVPFEIILVDDGSSDGTWSQSWLSPSCTGPCAAPAWRATSATKVRSWPA